MSEKPRVLQASRPRTTQGVLFRMVVGQLLIGLLLLSAIVLSVWQTNISNAAREDWESTLEHLSLITNVRQDSTVLVLVTHRVVYTQSPFQYLAPNPRFPTASISNSIADLMGSRNDLFEETSSLPDDDPIGRRLGLSIEYIDRLIEIARQSIIFGMTEDWESAQLAIDTVVEPSTDPEFEVLHSDLQTELRRAQILTQQDYVKAQEQMVQASRTSIMVTAIAAGVVVVLGILLSISTIRSISLPIRQLSEAAAQLAQGEFDTRVPVTRQDELGQLAQVFNYMASELDKIYSGLEARVGTAESRLLQAIEGIPEGFVLYDVEDRLILCNEKYREMRPEIADLIVPGVRFEDLIRKAHERGSYADDQASTDEWVTQRLDLHRNPRGPFDQQLSNGRWLQISEYTTREGGILGVRVDITERKLDDVELRKAKEEAEAAKETMSEFIANASHELRTPLTHVFGFAKVTLKDLIERIFPKVQAEDRRTQRAIKEVGESMEIIVEEGDRMANLINDMLDLAKIEAGKLQWDMQPLTIIDVIERAIASSSYSFADKDLKLIKDYPDEVPKILGDRESLMRVLLNLLSNAVKFTEKGSVTCRVRHIDDEIIVSVIDTGKGIAEEDHNKVFEKFAQAGDPHTGRSRGTGLGLTISKEIIEQHGGRIWVESEVGKGSIFSFSLPTSPSE